MNQPTRPAARRTPPPSQNPDGGADQVAATLLRGLRDAGTAGATPPDPAALTRLADGALRVAHRRGAVRRAWGAAGAAAAAVLVLVTAVQLLAPPHRTPTAPTGPTRRAAALPPRVNVALIGADAGADRVGVRPDSLMVVSIDTATGASTVIGLSRALSDVPFAPGSPAAAAHPQGFCAAIRSRGQDPSDCLLNGVWTFAEQHRDLWPGERRPGLTATVQAMEQVTGLHVDQFMYVDLRGLERLVDAVGGVTVKVRQRLPIGGSVEDPRPSGYFEPGLQHLDGYHALWYARSRLSTSDADRMARQQCLVRALSTQVDAVDLLTRWPAIATALGGGLMTSLSRDELPAWADLAVKAAHAPVRSLTLLPPLVDPARPDWDGVHALVREATAGGAAPPSTTSSTPSSTPSSTAPTATAPAC